MDNLVLLNDHYPSSYFTDKNLKEDLTKDFWASDEKLPPAIDYILFDFGKIRPINFVSFELCKKPLDFIIEYDNSGVWTEIDIVNSPSLSTLYMLSSGNISWEVFNIYFDLIQTQKIRITFTRRTDPFPFWDSKGFPWSIELKNFKAFHIVSNKDEFITNTGTDLLGNTYSTSLNIYDNDNVLDENTNTFWLSQPNPTKEAVESLYFDFTTSQANPRNSSVIMDQIYIDPITLGPFLHIYHSEDDENDWDNKLWIPVRRHYILKRGYHTLPSPISLKYLKLEFSNLSPIPYNLVEYPPMPPITYRKYPSWVQKYFNDLLDPPDLDDLEHIIIDPLKLGFVNTEDTLSDEARQQQMVFDEVAEFISTLGQTLDVNSQITRDILEGSINFKSSFVWQEDLMAQLNDLTAISRFVKSTDLGWASETKPIVNPAPTIQSTGDSTETLKEKTIPIMWFPRVCRHGYQILQSYRSNKLAYIVGIREISFHRNDYTIPFDEKIYIDTFEDGAHLESNDFVLVNDKLVVVP